MWLNIPDTDVPLIVSALRHARHASFTGIADKIEQDVKNRAAQNPAYIDAVPTDENLEVDPDTVVSAGGDPGAWVMAWVWVTNEAAGIETEGDAEE